MESIESVVLEHMRSRGAKFNSSGREDMDVRMLSDGRPFALQVHDPAEAGRRRGRRRDGTRHQRAVRNHRCARSRSVSHEQGVLPRRRTSVERTRKGEELRRRRRLSRPATLEDHEKIASTSRLVIQQATPTRVVHRRSDMVRPRTIVSMSSEEIPGSPDSVLLRLRTQAGTSRQRVRPRRRREDDSESRHSPRLSSEHHSTRRHRDQRRLEPERRVDDGQRLVSRARRHSAPRATPWTRPRVLFCGLEFSDGFNHTKSFVEERGLDVDVVRCPRECVLDEIRDADVAVPLMTTLDEDALSRGASGRLRLVLQFGVGLEGVDVDAASRHGVRVARIPLGEDWKCDEHGGDGCVFTLGGVASTRRHASERRATRARCAHGNGVGGL